MKIKRYFAADMRTAIRLVRDDQGPDAVILSNRRVEGGIEIIAAIDYDEAMIAAQAQAQAAVAPSAAPTPTESAPAAVSETAVAVTAATPTSAEATPAPATPAAVYAQAASQPAAAPGRTDIEWSQDPALQEMRREIKALRGLLENQVARLAWGDVARNQPQRAELLRRLHNLGLHPELCRVLADTITEQDEPDVAWRGALAQLAHRVPVADDEILNHGGVVALVGPTGVGKTTSVAKLAARYVLRHGQRKVALITTDNFRIGAHEQLLTFGRILGVPVQNAADQDELHSLIAGHADKGLILIDTAGMSQRDMRLSEQLATLHGGSPEIQCYLVLSATAQLAGLNESVQAFRRVPLSGCILTKVDEAASLGAALSCLIQNQLPLAYIGDGQRVPEDMHPARAHSLISRAVALVPANAVGDEDSLAHAFGGKVSHATV